MKRIILVGGGGHAESVADSILQSEEYEIVGYTTIPTSEKSLCFRYLGGDGVLQEYYDMGVKYAAICVGYLGDSHVRDILYRKVKAIGYQLPAIIDKTAILSNNISIGEGSFIGKGAVVNANSIIGKMCIINTRAVIEHKNQIGDFSHVSVNSVLCGDVTVQDHVFIGANSTIIQGKVIHSNSIIGAGSIILDDVPENVKAYGIWNNKVEKTK